MNQASSSLEVVLLFLEGENAGSEIRIEPPKELLIGRSEDCDIFVGEKKVSRKHAKLVVDNGGVLLEDLESTNGTFVEGKKITKVQIKDGETVRVGMTVFKVTILEGKALSSEGRIVSRAKKPASMTLESEPAEVPLEPSGDDNEKPLDLMSEGIDLADDEEENMEVERADERSEKSAEPVSKSQDKRKTLAGDLSQMSLPDILQMLKNNQRSGVLNISHDNSSGQICFADGQLTTASVGSVTGLKAIYRMLSFTDGNFEFEPAQDGFSAGEAGEKIGLSLENILIEGMRQIDEFEKIKKGLPAADSKLDINRSCESLLSKLHPKVLDVLQLVINHGSFKKVMDKSSLPDLETAKIVYYLVKKGYVLVG